MARPKTFSELFNFYNADIKPLYSRVQCYNVLPQETLFEINAAWDHVSRYYVSPSEHPEEGVVEKAYSHLKRSGLDIIKLKLGETIKQYNELIAIDLSLIDNGDGKFKKGLVALMGRIRDNAAEARVNEGLDFDGAWMLWLEVYLDCRKLETEYYNSEKVQWVKEKNEQHQQANREAVRKNLHIGFWLSVLASILAGLISGLVLGRMI